MEVPKDCAVEILIQKDTADKDINIQIENAVPEVEEGEIVAEDKNGN